MSKLEVSPAVLEARRRLKERMGAGLVQVGGKGSMRRKIKYKSGETKVNNSDKLELILKKIGVSDFGDVEEVYIFFNTAEYIEFKRPKFYGVVKHSTFIISGESTLRKIDMSSVFRGFNHNSGNMNIGTDAMGKIKDGSYNDVHTGNENINGNGGSSDSYSGSSSDSSDEDTNLIKKKGKGKTTATNENKVKDVTPGVKDTTNKKPAEEKLDTNEKEKREDGIINQSQIKCNNKTGNEKGDAIPDAVEDFEEVSKGE